MRNLRQMLAVIAVVGLAFTPQTVAAQQTKAAPKGASQPRQDPAKCNMHVTYELCKACAESRGYGPVNYNRPGQCWGKRGAPSNLR